MSKSLNPKNHDEIEDAISTITMHFEDAPWIPISILNLMYDIKYLNPKLYNFFQVWKNRKHGVNATYWQHFFGQVPLKFLLQQMLKDKIVYSTPYLNWKKNTQYVS